MLIDTHTHLESFARKGVLAETLARAREAGVEKMITIGTGPDDWELYRGIAKENAATGMVAFSVGLHPCAVEEGWEKAVGMIEGFWGAKGGRLGEASLPGASIPSWVPGSVPVALGECGLDRFHLPKEAAEAEKIFAWQRGAFAAQLEIAKRLACPVVVHSRGAFAECLAMIDASGVDWTKVVFHCFAEGQAEMKELMARGGRGSFTGIVTYKSAENVRAAARVQGLARLMIETDAPYLTPMPHRGKPNEPAFVRHTAEFCAKEVFGVSSEEFAAVTTGNAKKFFGI